MGTIKDQGAYIAISLTRVHNVPTHSDITAMARVLSLNDNFMIIVRVYDIITQSMVTVLSLQYNDN